LGDEELAITHTKLDFIKYKKVLLGNSSERLRKIKAKSLPLSFL